METEERKIGPITVILNILSLYAVAAFVLDSILVFPEEISKLLYYFDNFICLVFFIEFWVNLFTAANKLHYLKWGWIDLLSSIPMVGILRTGRVFRLIRLFRVIRAFKSTKHFLDSTFADRAKGTLSSLVVLAFLLLIFTSIAILQVETAPDSNIKSAEDAIWWTYSTMTTVGYGDKYPVTTEGRIIAMVLMTFGVGIFGTFTAYVASKFVKNK
jgi:voltage-gated potassium channel